MKTHSTDLHHKPPVERSESTRPSRAPVPADGPDKALNEAGAMGNQAFQRRGGRSTGDVGAASPATADALSPKSVKVEVTRLFGSTGDVTKCLDYANDKVFSQANVEVKGKEKPALDEAETRKILDGDLVLYSFPTELSPGLTAEEESLLQLNPVSNGVAMYLIEDFTEPRRGQAFPPFVGASSVAGVIANVGDETTFSHELGHVLLDAGVAEHSQPDLENIMFSPAGAKQRYKLTEEQINKVRSSPLVK